MKFGGKPTIADKAKAAEKRLGKTTGASKGKAPISGKPKLSARPTGGLKNLTEGPQGFRAKAEWKF